MSSAQQLRCKAKLPHPVLKKRSAGLMCTAGSKGHATPMNGFGFGHTGQEPTQMSEFPKEVS